MLAYATVGVPHHDIAVLVDMDTKTLLKHYRLELDRGKAEANAKATGKLFKLVDRENLGAIAFWLKCQAGWRERQVIEHTGPNGGPVKINTKTTVGTDAALRDYLDMINA